MRTCAALLVPLVACDLGPSPEAAQLQADLHAAVARGDATFTVAPGDYRFGATPLSIKDATGLTIEAAGATVWFEINGGVELQNCAGLTLRGLIGRLSFSDRYT